MPSSHLILCRPLLLPPPIPASIRVFSNESALRMRWPKYWSFSFSISPSSEHPGLVSLLYPTFNEHLGHAGPLTRPLLLFVLPPSLRDRLPTPIFLGFPGGSAGKESACDDWDMASISGLKRSPGEGKGYPLQYSGLENSMDCVVHGVAGSDMTERLSHSLALLNRT